ncbi:spermidine synthase [Streptomyces sp. TRM66268-LWL]|uniref:Spermidine synthase n=1 Tax=Streptomyces polyasparticus TaxID=2767826 RepID=A0ABR7S9G6_9ACTN|nr:spermidine synthase [Streptomyces polyasparticus]MBC9711282.1 spermidine synthase [Streptomyces polyasparticus]
MHVSYEPNDPTESTAAPLVLDRRTGPHGEVVLRRHGELLQIIANGVFLMDTSDGRSERLLVDAARDALPRDRARPSVLIGGLGVGFSLVHAAADERWARIDVVERERAIIEWHQNGPLYDISGKALADRRTRIIEADLLAYVHDRNERYDALCLDIDNGPDWTVTEGNHSLYSPQGLAACARMLNSGGVLAIWSAQPSGDFEESLRNAGFSNVRTEEIPVVRGVPDVVHLAIRAA